MRSRAPASSRGIAATLAALALAGAAAALLVWPGRGAPPRPPSAESPDIVAPEPGAALEPGAAQAARSASDAEAAGGRRRAAQAPEPSPARERASIERVPSARGIVPEPEPEPLPDGDRGATIYAAAIMAGDKNPGEKAFRADSEAFFEHNLGMAQEKAAREGITLAELQELTYLGNLAMHLMRWEAVAEVLGHDVPAEARERAEKLIFSASEELKATIRRQVAEGKPAEARWATIRAIEARLVDEYRAITGLSPEQLDALLALPYTAGQGAGDR
ncbi:hypothetical protein [Sorangium sp. So ce1389]|uniref:hypothetical protein n=1 Tax=Sorangium sp. So ce1389 TaxID=3133336 RepID=UPI003F6285D6